MKYGLVVSSAAADRLAALTPELRTVVEEHLDRLCEAPTQHSRPSAFPFPPNLQLSTFEHRDVAREVHCFNIQFRFGQDEQTLQVLAIGHYIGA